MTNFFWRSTRLAFDHAVSVEGAAWSWIATHAPVVLIAIYFATLGCMLVLTIYVRSLSRQIRRAAAELARHGVVLEPLPGIVEGHTRLIEAMPAAGKSTPRRRERDDQALEQLCAEVTEMQRRLLSVERDENASPLNPLAVPAPVFPGRDLAARSIRAEIEALKSELTDDRPGS